MTTTDEKLESLFAKVRALPAQHQEQVVEALVELTNEPYRLTEDELAILVPELEGARRGEFASQAEVDAVLRSSWSPPSDV